MIHRRTFLTGLLAAPVIIKTPGLIMPVKPSLVFEPNVVTGTIIFGDFFDFPDEGVLRLSTSHPNSTFSYTKSNGFLIATEIETK
ncbi:MAG: hypothetical protein ACR2O3_09715, partial [Rhizobiaceae bacterium]